MPPPVPLQFGASSYNSSIKQLSSQRCLNMYAERAPKGAKSEIVVRGAPGITTFATCGNGPIRAMHEFEDVLYVVSGQNLYTVSEVGVATVVGGQIPGTGPVSIDNNSLEIAIANSSHGYIYDNESGFRVITDEEFHPANTVTTIDSFFCWDRIGTNEFFISDSYDGSTYSDFFASAETKSDNTIAVFNNLQLLHIFGKRTIEFWQNIGATNFPFRRLPGGVINRGIAGKCAFGQEDNTVHLVCDDRIGYRIVGMKLDKITTAPIDERWQAYPTVTDCEVFGYTFEGHKFMVFNFLAACETWVFDISSQLWHERTHRDVHNNELKQWCGSCSAAAYNKTFIGNRYNGQIGYLDRSVFTEFGNQIVGEIVAPPLYGGGKMVTMPWLEVNMETGNGTATGQGVNPQVMLSISDDGGRTFDGPTYWATSGKVGEYSTQVRFGALGSFYERTMKLQFADPVRWNFISAYAPDMEVGV